mmetsp:Transcript_64179/g.150647  ORF Transcript_64179/g.150647 Transcript_64179/m.150647 type:complete len:224 (-) Transcript_64179:1157-1828(-)
MISPERNCSTAATGTDCVLEESMASKRSIKSRNNPKSGRTEVSCRAFILSSMGGCFTQCIMVCKSDFFAKGKTALKKPRKDNSSGAVDVHEATFSCATSCSIKSTSSLRLSAASKLVMSFGGCSGNPARSNERMPAPSLSQYSSRYNVNAKRTSALRKCVSRSTVSDPRAASAWVPTKESLRLLMLPFGCSGPCEENSCRTRSSIVRLGLVELDTIEFTTACT